MLSIDRVRLEGLTYIGVSAVPLRPILEPTTKSQFLGKTVNRRPVSRAKTGGIRVPSARIRDRGSCFFQEVLILNERSGAAIAIQVSQSQ